MRKEALAQAGRPGQGAPPLWTPNFTLAIAANFALFMAFQLLLPTLPLYALALGMSEGAVGLIVGAFTITALLVRPWMGGELDRRGRKPVMFLGLGVCLAATILYHFAASLQLLLILRLLHGVGWGASTTALVSIIGDLAPPSRREEGLEIYGLSASLPMIIAPTLGVVVMNVLGFTALLVFSMALVAAALFLGSRLALRRYELKDWQKFIIYEPAALAPSLVLFFPAGLIGSVIYFISLYATHLGIGRVGLFFIFYALATLASRPLAALLVDRKGADVVVIPSFILVIAAAALLALAPGPTGFLVAAVLLGLGNVIYPALLQVTLARATVTRQGAANATLTSALDLGIGFGCTALGTAAARIGYGGMYLAAAAGGLLGLFAYLVLLLGSRKDLRRAVR